MVEEKKYYSVVRGGIINPTWRISDGEYWFTDKDVTIVLMHGLLVYEVTDSLKIREALAWKDRPVPWENLKKHKRFIVSGDFKFADF